MRFLSRNGALAQQLAILFDISQSEITDYIIVVDTPAGIKIAHSLSNSEQLTGNLINIAMSVEIHSATGGD